MLGSYVARVATVATVAFLGFGTTLDAQISPAQQAQQLQRMQEQAQRVEQTMQRMAQVQQRAHEMEQLMLQDMERVRQQQALHEQEGIQLQMQERMRQQEQVRVMAQAVSGAAGGMVQAMTGLREMAGDPDGATDREMAQHMERLQEHMQGTCDQMEAGLAIMEQLRERLSQP